MASQPAYDLIKAEITALLAPMVVIDYDQVGLQLNRTATTFAALEDTAAFERVASIGSPASNWLVEEGQIDVHLFAQAVNGHSPIRSTAYTLQQQLRLRFLNSTVRILAVDPPAPGFIAEGIWSSMIVTVSYENRFTAPTYVA